MDRSDGIYRSTANGYMIYPKDLWAGPGIRAIFTDVAEIMGEEESGRSYGDDNSIAMRFVQEPDCHPVDRPRVEVDLSSGAWEYVQPWWSDDRNADYVLLLGRRYRVVATSSSSSGGPPEAVFEVHPPYYADVASVCRRSTSSFGVHLHKMLLGQE